MLILSTNQAGYYKWAPGDYGYGLVIQTGGQFGFVEADGNTWSYATSSQSYAGDNKWHHLMGVRRNGTAYIYVDGVEQPSTTTLTPAFSDPKALIGWHGYSGQAFGGLIDRLRIYNRALTANEIRSNMNSATPIADGLVANWHFDEGTGTTVADSSGNGNNGTIYGAGWVGKASWYEEPFSSTRGHKDEFPEKAYLVATDAGLDIIDAGDNKLWMRFEKSAGWTSANVIVDQLNYGGVFALNGKVYVTAPWSGLVSIDFANDSVLCRGNNPSYGGDYLGDISQRNAGAGYSMDYSGTIAHYDARAVHGNIVGGETYIAVATGAGISLINENTGRIVSLLSQDESLYPDFDTSDIVWLTSDGTLYSQLYRESDSSNRILLCVNYEVQEETTDFDGCDAS